MFELAATAALGFVMVIWPQNGLVNLALKYGFLCLALWGTVEAANEFNIFHK